MVFMRNIEIKQYYTVSMPFSSQHIRKPQIYLTTSQLMWSFKWGKVFVELFFFSEIISSYGFINLFIVSRMLRVTRSFIFTLASGNKRELL